MKKYLTHLLIFALILSIGGNIYFVLSKNNDDNVKSSSGEKITEEDCEEIAEIKYIYQDSTVIKDSATTLYNDIHLAMYNNSAPDSVDLIYSNAALTDKYKNLLAFGSVYEDVNKNYCETEKCLSYSVDLTEFEAAYEKMFGTKIYSKIDFNGDKTNTCKFEEDKINCYYNSLIENWDGSDSNPYFESYIINELADIRIENDYVIISEKHLDVVIINDKVDISITDDKEENLLDKYISKIKNNTLTESEINEIISDNVSLVEEYEFYFKIIEDGSIYFEEVKEK